MQIIHEEVIFDIGSVSQTSGFSQLYNEVLAAIKKTDWPEGSGNFTIKPIKHENGVKPIKIPFIKHLKNAGWNLETVIDYGVTKRNPGPVDATHPFNDKLFAVEWETGNISSSHRALSKLAIGISKGILSVGILVLPSRKLYNFLTDRVGNYQELEPYFDMYRLVNCHYGLFKVIEVEHDIESHDVPSIPKGDDGNALYQKRLAELRNSSKI